MAAYTPRRWQWAEKLAAYLEDKGHAEVEVLDVEIPDEEVQDLD